ncbi:unnamed protein product [Rotaria sp. Silwood1]|nr:unnamed protein product [Rotaria sp. Silwood1]CAF3353673.1 unnamed protein product [Rotaria sp. Silwood1]CAF3381030.1 unnamed protein product [Rotaria sp. Silwood1]CAF4518524.1 unnamed protein product [Rotaria sp. Silwood1]CAF4647977.1 unnamed protein product [Rotaria sp. Silwood1]
MENRRRTDTEDSSSEYSQAAIAILDPLLETVDHQRDTSEYYRRQSSVFHISATIKSECDNENIDSNKTITCFIKCFRHVERFSGILYALLASVLFTSSNFIIQQLNIILLDVFLIRFFLQGITLLGFVLYKGYHPFLCSNSLLVFIRSLTAAAGSVCFYIGLVFLPLPDLLTLRYTQVVWTALLVLIIFRERITIPIIIASILTLMGVIGVAQPSFIFSKSNTFNKTSEILLTNNNKKRLLGIFVALLCAFSISMSFVLTKKLFEKKVRQSIMLFHFILTTLVFLLISQTYYWTYSKTNHQKFNIKRNYLTKDFFRATILATLQLIPMILLQKSIKREHPSIVTIVQSSDILFSIILQNVFSNIKSNTYALIGSTLVLTSIIIVGGHKFWQDRKHHTSLSTSVEEKK